MLLEAIFGRSSSRALTPSPSDDYWYNPVGLSSAAGVRVDERTAINYSAVWAATRLIAETTAWLPFVMFERLAAGGKQAASAHPVFRFASGDPNIGMTNMIFREVMTARAVNWGNAYAEIERTKGGIPLNLWPIHPSRVKISDTKREADGRITYFVTQDSGGKTPVDGEDMIHLLGANSDDGLFGRGVVRFGRESIGMGLATERYGAGFFGNGARPGGVLEHPAKMSETAQKNLRESWNRVHQGPGSGHNLAILEEGMKYHTIDIPPEMAQFLETRTFNITEIARWYGLPPHKLAELSRATFSNIEHLAIEFKEALVPWMVKWQQEFSRKLLRPAERTKYYFEHVLSDLLKADTKARAEYYKDLFDRGVFSVNDILEMEGRNPIGPEGDVRFVPMNFIPLHKAEEVAQATIDAKKPVEPDGDEEPEGQEPPTKPAKKGKGIPKAKDASEGNVENSIAVTQFDALAERVDEMLVQLQVTYSSQLAITHKQAAEQRERQVKAAEQVLQHEVNRMLTREANEARRAAKKPGEFFAWLDGFYATHAEYLKRDLRPALACYLTATDSLRDPDDALADLMDRHIDHSKAQLLDAADGDPDKFADRIEATVASWGTSRQLLIQETVRD